MIQEITEEYFPDIDMIFHIENDMYYSEKIEQALNGLKNQVDAFIFGGEVQYKLYYQVFFPDVLCYHIKKDSSSLLNSLLALASRGIDVTRVSIDNYAPSVLTRILSDIGVKEHKIKLLRRQSYSKQYFQRIYEEHKDLYEAGETAACITTLTFIYKQLQQEGIPVVYSRPTTDNIIKTIQHTKEEYLLKQTSQANDLAVMMIRIQPKAEYSYICRDEYLMNHQRIKAEEELYFFAKNRGASVISRSWNQYAVLIKEADLAEYTNDFETLPLLSDIINNTDCSAYIGIGMGFNPAEAFYHGNLALEKACAGEENGTYLVYNSSSVSGPLYFAETEKQQDKSRIPFAELAKNSGISEAKLRSIYSLIEKTRKNHFTAAELARYLRISLRTANRLLSDLEAHHFARFLSLEVTGNAGRPKNIYEISLELPRKEY